MSNIIAAWLFTAFSAFEVIGGVNGLAPGAGIVSSDFFKPLLIANRLYSFEIIPKLDAVRHCGLKKFQLITRILFTFAAKIDSSFSRACDHFAFPAIGQPLAGAASIARALFLRKVHLCCKLSEPFRIFMSGDIP